jgi:hypothetical protein
MIMEKYIVFFKKIAVVTGLLSIILIISDLLFKISIVNINGIYIAFTSLIAILFLISLYSFFIFSDIKKDNFICLSKLNHIALFTALLFFIYWGIIYPDALAFLFPSYFVIFTIINLLIMSIIYLIKKTGGKYFFKEWLYFFWLIAVFVLYIVIMSLIKS